MAKQKSSLVGQKHKFYNRCMLTDDVCILRNWRNLCDQKNVMYPCCYSSTFKIVIDNYIQYRQLNNSFYQIIFCQLIHQIWTPPIIMYIPGVGAFLELRTFSLYLFKNFWAHPLDAMKSGHSGVISSCAFLQIIEIVSLCFLVYCLSTQLRSFMSSSLPYFTGLPLFGLLRLRSSLGESRSIFIQ